MNGGWLSKSPFMFDAKNNIIPIDYDSDNFKHTALYTETVKKATDRITGNTYGGNRYILYVVPGR